MIISDNINLKDREILINGNILKHSSTMRVLGTLLSDNLKWNSYICEGKNSLLSQLKKEYQQSNI